MNIARRLRGVLGIATTWGVSFAAFGSLIALVVGGIAVATGAISFQSLRAIGAVEMFAAITRWFALGAVTGVGFALAVIRKGRGQSISQLKRNQFARWGFVAGAVGGAVVGGALMAAARLLGQIPPDIATTRLIVGGMVGLAVVGGAFGAGMATATLRGAQHGESVVEEGEPVLSS